jgi:hypothetical protein
MGDRIAPETLVDLCGTGRCGTTMLDLMLGNSKRTFSCGEASGVFRPRKPDPHHIQCSCGEDPCPIWERIKAGPEQRFRHDVVDALGVERVVDSSTYLHWIRDANRWAPDNGMRAVYVPRRTPRRKAGTLACRY